MKKPTAALVLAAVVSLLLGACGGSSDTSSSGGTGTAQVGVILPDTTSSDRWVDFDAPYLEKAFTAAGYTAQIENAQGDTTKFASIADSMIASGVQVIIMAAIDSESGAQIEQTAADAGVKIIDYDRLTLGGTADYYVSFDNVQVGKLMGAHLVSCVGNLSSARIIEVHGSQTDNNATLFKTGYEDQLDARYESGWKKVGEGWVAGWDNTVASTTFTQLLKDADNDVDGVLVANDGMAQSVIKALKKAGLKGVPVTGQDATVAGLQSVLAGDQCMTVYKAVKAEANGAVAAAVALINGTSVPTTGTTRDDVGQRDVPSVLLSPEGITAEEVRDVIDDGFVSATDVCTGKYKKYCTEYGIEYDTE